MKKKIALALKVLVTGFCFWFLLGRVDLGATMTMVARASLGMVALCAALYVFQVVICAFRWQAVMISIGGTLSFADLFRIFYIGAFFNQILPSSVGGDVIRVYKVYRSGHGLAAAVNGVMLDRAATVLALVLMVMAAAPVFLDRAGAEAGGWIIPVLVLVGGAALAGMALLMVLDRLPARLGRWRVVRGLARLAADARRVFLHPRTAGGTLGWAVAGHANLTLGVYILALGLDLEVSWLDCVALFLPVLLITTLPISLAGWGVRELAMVPAFALIGVPEEGAFALSVLFGLLVMVTGLPGGMIWLLGRDRARDIDVSVLSADASAGNSGKA